MTSKVKISEHEAEVIERVKYGKTKEQVIRNSFMYTDRYAFTGSVTNEVRKMGIDKVIKVLYIGYEVEPEFKIGDSLIDGDGNFIKVQEIISDGIGYIDGFFGCKTEQYKSLRYATDKEKKVNFWSERDRKVWELKRGDIIRELNKSKKLTIDAFSFNRVFMKDGSIITHQDLDNFVVVCFTEDRQDNA